MKSAQLLSILCSAKRGVKPKFTPYHILKTLLYLTERPHGRMELSRKLGLGEASTRTLIQRLKVEGLIDVDKIAGAFLTDKGRKVIDEMLDKIILVGSINVKDYCEDCRGYCIVIRRGLTIVRDRGVLAIRDLVVREGAYGAIIAIFKEGRFLLPVAGNAYEEFRDESLKKFLLSRVTIMEDDAIMISLCKGEIDCSMPLINAAIHMLSAYDNDSLNTERRVELKAINT